MKQKLAAPLAALITIPVSFGRLVTDRQDVIA